MDEVQPAIEVPLGAQPLAIRWPVRLLATVPASLMLALLLWQLQLPVPLVIAICVVGAVAAAGWVLLAKRRPPAPPPLRIDPVAVGFPGRGRFGRLVDVVVPLADLVLVRALNSGLLLATKSGGAHLVPRPMFPPQTPPEQVLEALVRFISLRPDAEAMLRRLEDNEARAVAFQQRKTPVTFAAAALCVGLFLIELRTGALEESDGRTLLRLGANAPALVRQGEIWRLVTANLLHGSLLHLAMNVSALLGIGAVLERWLGRTAFFVVLFGSCVGGALGSALAARAPMSVGISTGLFGLLGVLLVTSVRYRQAPLAGPRVPLRSWIWMILINGGLSLLPIVDGAAHGAGLLAGILLALLIAPAPGRAALLRGRSLAVVGILCGLVILAAGAAAVLAAAPAGP